MSNFELTLKTVTSCAISDVMCDSGYRIGATVLSLGKVGVGYRNLAALYLMASSQSSYSCL